MRTPGNRGRTVLAGILTALSLAGCGESGGTPLPPPRPSISVEASPASLTFPAGAGGSSAVTVTRGGGFTGAVELAATGAPAGLTVTLTPSTVPSGVVNSTLTLTSAGSLTPGSYPITITGTGGGTSGTSTFTATVTAALIPAVNVSVAPAAATIVAGASGTATATIARTGGFTGAVTMSASGAPTGVTVSFTPATIEAASTTTSIGVAVAGTVAAGNYPITITASGTGITPSTAVYTLTVVPAPTLGVAVAPTTAAITAGNSGSATVTITRGGSFTGDVTLTASGAPTGMTVSFTPATIAASATTSALVVGVAGSTTPGTYPITISAAGTGVTTATATLTVTVAAAVNNNVTLAFCAEDAPIWLAVQDGTGAWTRVTPNSGTSTYEFALNSGRGAVAAVHTVAGGFDLNVYFATVSEFNGFSGTSALGDCESKTINGSVANVSATQVANVSLGMSSAVVVPGGANTFQLDGVAPGAQTLFAARVNDATLRADRLILRRGLNIANNGTLPVLDFGAAESFATATANFTIANLGTDNAIASTSFIGTRGAVDGIITTVFGITSAGVTRTFDVMPAAQLQTGELQQYSVFADGGSGVARFGGVYFRTPADRTVTLGPGLLAPTVTRLTSAPYARARVQLARQTQYNRSFTASFEQASTARTALLFASAAYMGSGAWDLSIPDLSGVAGWQNSWGMTGSAITWSVLAGGGVQFAFDPTATEGSTFTGAQRSGTLP